LALAAVPTGVAKAGPPWTPLPRQSALRVAPIAPPEPPIGHNRDDRNYFDATLTLIPSPHPPSLPEYDIPPNAVFLRNFYLREIQKYGRPVTVTVDRDNPYLLLEHRFVNLRSGTIYQAYQTAFYRWSETTSTGNVVSFTQQESPVPNFVKVLTNINVEAYPYDGGKLRIVWDDVWDLGARIEGYKIYISQSPDFVNTEPIYVRQEHIGPGRDVVPNESAGTLEYIYSNPTPSAVYYIKIAPDTRDADLNYTPDRDLPAFVVSTHILGTTTKMATTEAGTIWRLSWTPVVLGMSTANIDVSYKIYRGRAGVSGLPQYVSTISPNNEYYFTVPNGEDDHYFQIRAEVVYRSTGQNVFPVEIYSEYIYVLESLVPSTPQAPELVEWIERIPGSPGTTVISFEDRIDPVSGDLIRKGELTPTAATLIWRTPRLLASGAIDPDVRYDVWVTSDPSEVDDPPDSRQVARDLYASGQNLVLDPNNASNVLGYKLPISGLTPNTGYYAKVVAKKDYPVYDDFGRLRIVTFTSAPSYKQFITPVGDDVYKPEAPGRLPFRMKTVGVGGEDRYEIGPDRAIAQLMNKWHERYDPDKDRWEFHKDPPYVDGLSYRVVEYDAGVTYRVGLARFVDGMSVMDLPTDYVIDIPMDAPDLPFVAGRGYNPDLTEDAAQSLDNKRHNIDVYLTGLEPNTTYIIWARAERKSMGLISEPSDPVVFTTAPSLPETILKPTIPVIDYVRPGDVYLDLGWNYVPGQTYTLRISPTDDIRTASGDIKVSPADYQSYYRLEDLRPETMYYIWIRAELSENGLHAESDWSDSCAVMTLKLAPPPAPMGFGTKSGPNAITKDSIFYEWYREAGMEYILEVATNAGFTDSVEFACGSVAEFEVTGLISNHLYYARLYAYDPKKGLRSVPTYSIYVRTGKSFDDYDSNEDLDNVITGDFVVFGDKVEGGVWDVSIVGVNADRFIEHVRGDRRLYYVIDAAEPPAKASAVRVTVAKKVFESLNRLGEVLIVMMPECALTIRPYAFPHTDPANVLGSTVNYEILVTAPYAVTPSAPYNVQRKTPAVSVAVTALGGGVRTPIAQLPTPLSLEFAYDGAGWFLSGDSAAYSYGERQKEWSFLGYLTNRYDMEEHRGKVSFDMNGSGVYVAGNKGAMAFDDIAGSRYASSINNIAKVYDLRSIGGRLFNPASKVTMLDAVRLGMDVMGYDHAGRDVMREAVLMGMVLGSDIGALGEYVTRERAAYMAVRIYEAKTGQRAAPSGAASAYRDLGGGTPALQGRLAFAAEYGIAVGSGGLLSPLEQITKGELAFMLERVMALAGELEL